LYFYIHGYLSTVPVLSAIITDIIYPLPNTDIFNWNKAENLLIVLYG